MVESLLTYYYFEFNGYVKHQILSTAIVTALESAPLVQFHIYRWCKLELFLIALTIITWKLNLPYSLIKKAFFLELKIFLRTIQPLTLTLSLQTGIFLLCIWTSRSYQTLHLFKSTLRNNRICSYKKDLEIHLDNILWFSARCYPKTLFMKR